MNKVIFGLGILILIIGVIIAVFDAAGVFYTPFNNPFSKTYDLLQEAFAAIVLIVVGGIFVFLGSRKSKSS